MKTLAEKLFIKTGMRLCLLNTPEGYLDKLNPLPPGVQIISRLDSLVDMFQVFVRSQSDVLEELPRLKGSIKPAGLLWICYPKGSAKAGMDVNRDTIWKYARTIGLDGVAMISIDETWSAMRLKVVV